MLFRRYLPLVVASLCLCLNVFADTGSLLLLYTNDIHDYIKPGPDDLGGLPYIAGYVASVREERSDILLLDGGDVMEKGDMVAHKTQSRITYEAMSRIGYDAGAVGNHDLVHGVDHLRECAELAGMAMLCLNYFDADGKPYFPASKMFDVQGVRVAVVGLTNLKGGPYLDLPECGRRLAEESARLKNEAHLVVVVAHIGSSELAQLSVLAPAVDVFVGGHTHELLREPRIVSETGALIVMAGHYARHVGRLDLQVDLENGGIASWENELVAMAHDVITPDRDMIAWVEAEEAKYYPEATEIIGRSERAIMPNDMARLAASAIRARAEVDIAFCHTGQIMRSSLPAGDIDANLLFRTGGQRGRNLLRVELTGAQIAAYVSGLIQDRRGRTEWSGFDGTVRFNRDADQWEMEANLDPERIYVVALPEREWETRFERVARDNPVFTGLGEPQDLEFTFTEALAVYVRGVSDSGHTLDAYLDRLR